MHKWFKEELPSTVMRHLPYSLAGLIYSMTIKLKINTSNKKQVSPNSCTVPMSYYRSNLTTEIPERKNQVTEQCSVCGSKIEKNNISQMSCDKTVSVSDNSLYRKSYL